MSPADKPEDNPADKPADSPRDSTAEKAGDDPYAAAGAVLENARIMGAVAPDAVGYLNPKSHTDAGRADTKASAPAGEIDPAFKSRAAKKAGGRKGKGGGKGGESGGEGGGARRYRPPMESLPEDCPVTPLGMIGDSCLYLDAIGQFTKLRGRDHARLAILQLFGPRNEILADYFPSYNKDGEPTGKADYQRAAEVLIRDCGLKGVINPMDRIRGVGAWTGEDGRLILHCGDRIFKGPAAGTGSKAGEKPRMPSDPWQRPGEIGAHIYPGQPAAMRPFARNEKARRQAGRRLFEILKQWHWRRGDIDARLILGWVVCAFLGGALKWRPMVWVTGGRGTGKSTLHDYLRDVLGEWRLFTSDATAAGIWQALGYDARAVALDELESDPNGDKAQKVIYLARQAGSGGVILRGGQSHDGAQFTARACFMFSSIFIPALTPQDRSRMAILDLNKIRTTKLPDGTPEQLREIGRHLLQHLVENWYRWEATLTAYREALQAVGHSARAVDQFGTLLAAHDMALADGLMEPEILAGTLAEELSPAKLAESDVSDGDDGGALEHLLSTTIEIERERRSLGAFLQEAWACLERQPNSLGEAYRDDDDRFKKLNRGLADHGVRFVSTDGEHRNMLAVAGSHAGLRRIFAGSTWQSAAGTRGVWLQALGRLEGARATPHPVRFNGPRTRGVLLPPDLVVDMTDPKAPPESPDREPETGRGHETEDLS